MSSLDWPIRVTVSTTFSEPLSPRKQTLKVGTHDTTKFIRNSSYYKCLYVMCSCCNVENTLAGDPTSSLICNPWWYTRLRRSLRLSLNTCYAPPTLLRVYQPTRVAPRTSDRKDWVVSYWFEIFSVGFMAGTESRRPLNHHKYFEGSYWLRMWKPVSSPDPGFPKAFSSQAL